MNAKYMTVAILALVLIGAVSYLMLNSGGDTVTIVEKTTPTDTDRPIPVEPDGGIGDGAEPLDQVMEEQRGGESTLGSSVNGEDIMAYHFGDGETEIVLVGGTHGSYSPNTSELMDEAVDYYKENEDSIPESITLTIIPNLNPDGSALSGTAGRFNANEVDLNRNFDCEWSEKAVWRQQEVSGGSEPFSEPEAEALRDYFELYEPTAAIVWFSAEGKVYPSACGGTPSKASVELAATFATAAGYPAAAEFDAYAITGDMVNWMAKEGYRAISVLLSDHSGTEWSKNRAGIEAVLTAYSDEQ
jgi:hypothetical protein